MSLYDFRIIELILEVITHAKGLVIQVNNGDLNILYPVDTVSNNKKKKLGEDRHDGDSCGDSYSYKKKYLVSRREK